MWAELREYGREVMVAVAREKQNASEVVTSALNDVPSSAREIGIAFAAVVVTRDWPGLSRLLHPEVDYRGLSPARAWLAVGPEQVCGVLRAWSAEEGHPTALDHLTVEEVSSRHRLTYRLAFDAAGRGAEQVCEHTLYFDLDDARRITFARMMSSGVAIRRS